MVLTCNSFKCILLMNYLFLNDFEGLKLQMKNGVE